LSLRHRVRPVSRSVQNGQDGEPTSIDAIGIDVRRTRDNQLARFRFATRAAKVGMLHKPVHERENFLSQFSCSVRFVLFDKPLNFNEVENRSFSPNYVRDGGGSFRR
jgi:hypothetical protein